MNRRIGKLGVTFILMFLLLVVNLTYLQFFVASELSAKPENIRPLLNERKVKRGDVVSADGKVLATSREVDGGYKRYYPYGEMTAFITGFYSTKYGRSGLELTYDEYLSGQTKVSSIDDYIERLLGRDVPGNKITLSLDMDIQRVATEALGSNKGAVVVLNPKTGAVLALVSKPGFDPNKVEENWRLLAGSPDGVMVDRALRGRFIPGSSFKIVTAAAALESGLVSTDIAFDGSSSIKIHGGKVTNYEGIGYGNISFEEAFIKSVNTVFGQVGKDLGGKKMVEAAKSFGLGSKIPFDLTTKEGGVPRASDMDELEVAWMAVGQGRTLATPLNMALVGAAVANDGGIMQPYLVERIEEHDGNVVFSRRTQVWMRPMSKDTAETLKGLMEKVVTEGTGKRAQIESIRVAGKTGTAEVGDKPPHAWFVSFAPVEDPQVVVVVVVENGGQGGRVAAPIAREILKSALGKNR